MVKHIGHKTTAARSKRREVFAAFSRTENEFERYLLADRIDLLNGMPGAIKDVRAQLDQTMSRFMKAFGGVQSVLRKVQNRNIYTMCRVDDKGQDCKNEDDCYGFLSAFLETLESLISVLTLENALHFKRIELLASKDGGHQKVHVGGLESHDVDLEEKLRQTIDVLKACLRFLNKNSAEDVTDFFLLRKSNPQLFVLVNSVRVFSYVIRAYLKYILLKKTSRYTVSTGDYEYVLNDCNKVANILERDFHISSVQHEYTSKKRGTTTADKNRKWVYLSAIAADFLRGHVYYGMKNNSRALDFFYRGIRLFDKVSTLKAFSAIDKSPFDLAKAKLMMGKVFSDKGLFLDSLLWHLSALDGFLALFQHKSDEGIRKAIRVSADLLLKEKQNDIVSKEVVSRILASIQIRDLDLNDSPNSTAAWAKGYVSDVINRAGYVFYILLWRNADIENKDRIKSWYDVALRVSSTNSLARQNLCLIPGTHNFQPEWLLTMDDPAKKLNLLALLQLNMAYDGISGHLS